MLEGVAPANHPLTTPPLVPLEFYNPKRGWMPAAHCLWAGVMPAADQCQVRHACSPLPVGGEDACPFMGDACSPLPVGGKDACPFMGDACSPLPLGGEDASPQMGFLLKPDGFRFKT